MPPPALAPPLESHHEMDEHPSSLQPSASSTAHSDDEGAATAASPSALEKGEAKQTPILRGVNGNPIAYSRPTAGQRTPSITTVQSRARGMSQTSSLRRYTSNPPAVTPFGGVAPEDDEEDEGFMAVRSREEADARELRREEKGEDPWRVKFEHQDPANPKNWSSLRRWIITLTGAILVLNSTFASSAPSGIVTDVRAEFGIGQEVAILTISLFVAGYCLGPLLWGPLSESYGRRPVFIIAFVFYIGFQVGCALSPNAAALLVFRFLGGTFAACPLTNAGAVLGDVWDADRRGRAMSFFSLAPFAGPSFGPIISGYISVSGTDWRWVYWISTMFAGFCLVLIVFVMPETYAPTLLVHKAKRLRKETGQSEWYAPLERADHSLAGRLNDILVKPFKVLALEPMLQAVTLYMSFVYGCVYLLFEAYPIVFVGLHGFNAGEQGLAFLGFFLGGALSTAIYIIYFDPKYKRKAAALAPAPVPPEARLEMCVWSGWALVLAFFWFAWSSFPQVHWISNVLAGGLLGVGVLGIFVSSFNYMIDVYLFAAASALSANTVARSTFGAGFPLFAGQMYDKLNPRWASSLLGFIALLLAPVPMILIKYGPKLRARSKFSPAKY